MSRRRPKGSGTIERTRDGKFRARFPFVPGRREDIDGSPFVTQREAEDALDGLLAQLREAGVTRGGITLRKAASHAFDVREKAGYRSVGSERDRWNAYLENHELANCPLPLVGKADVRDLLGSLKHRKTKKPLGTQTKRNVLNMLRSVFEIAVEDEHLADNPLVGMKVKDVGRTDDVMRPLPWALAKRLLEVATDPVVPIAIGTGMRSGELRSLRWEDVFLDDRSPHVMVRYGAPPSSPRKNGKVLRVPLFGMALDAMSALFAETNEEDRVGAIFRSKRRFYRTKGRVVEPKSWRAWLDAAGISRRVRFHDLRHTCATLLLNGDLGRKWSYEEVKELLGHSSVKVTERYAKALGTLAEKAAAAMRRPKRKPATSPHSGAPEVAQAREILERRGSDSNRRMTVLQFGNETNDPDKMDRLAGLARAYVEAVAAGDPRAIAMGLRLAEEAWEEVAFERAEEAAG